MKKFVVNCDFGGQGAPFAVYIGIPEGGHHPLHFQADWLSKNRGGSIPPNIMDAVGKLKDLADKNKVSLEELCVYALGAAQQEKDHMSEETNAEEAGEEETDEDMDFDDLVFTEPDEKDQGEGKEYEQVQEDDVLPAEEVKKDVKEVKSKKTRKKKTNKE